eukprot:COSAG02_NODE_195_length_29750_cov_79.793329_22_plen_141_part_00
MAFGIRRCGLARSLPPPPACALAFAAIGSALFTRLYPSLLDSLNSIDLQRPSKHVGQERRQHAVLLPLLFLLLVLLSLLPCCVATESFTARALCSSPFPADDDDAEEEEKEETSVAKLRPYRDPGHKALCPGSLPRTRAY